MESSLHALYIKSCVTALEEEKGKDQLAVTKCDLLGVWQVW